MAVEADGDVILSALDGVFRYDGVSGERTTLTLEQPGEFFSPHGVAVVVSVPEPTTLALVGCAIVALAALRPKWGQAGTMTARLL